MKVRANKACRCRVWRVLFTRMENPNNVGVDFQRVRLNHLMRFSANFDTFRKVKGAFENLAKEGPHRSFVQNREC